MVWMGVPNCLMKIEIGLLHKIFRLTVEFVVASLNLRLVYLHPLTWVDKSRERSRQDYDSLILSQFECMIL